MKTCTIMAGLALAFSFLPACLFSQSGNIATITIQQRKVEAWLDMLEQSIDRVGSQSRSWESLLDWHRQNPVDRTDSLNRYVYILAEKIDRMAYLSERVTAELFVYDSLERNMALPADKSGEKEALQEWRESVDSRHESLQLGLSSALLYGVMKQHEAMTRK